jgi:hypothetical protein
MRRGANLLSITNCLSEQVRRAGSRTHGHDTLPLCHKRPAIRRNDWLTISGSFSERAASNSWRALSRSTSRLQPPREEESFDLRSKNTTRAIRQCVPQPKQNIRFGGLLPAVCCAPQPTIVIWPVKEGRDSPDFPVERKRLAPRGQQAEGRLIFAPAPACLVLCGEGSAEALALCPFD